MKWTEALKIWNGQKHSSNTDHSWIVPRAGTKEHDEIKKIQAQEKTAEHEKAISEYSAKLAAHKEGRKQAKESLKAQKKEERAKAKEEKKKEPKAKKERKPKAKSEEDMERQREKISKEEEYSVKELRAFEARIKEMDLEAAKKQEALAKIKRAIALHSIRKRIKRRADKAKVTEVIEEKKEEVEDIVQEAKPKHLVFKKKGRFITPSKPKSKSEDDMEKERQKMLEEEEVIAERGREVQSKKGKKIPKAKDLVAKQRERSESPKPKPKNIPKAKDLVAKQKAALIPDPEELKSQALPPPMEKKAEDKPKKEKKAKEESGSAEDDISELFPETSEEKYKLRNLYAVPIRQQLKYNKEFLNKSLQASSAYHSTMNRVTKPAYKKVKGEKVIDHDKVFDDFAKVRGDIKKVDNYSNIPSGPQEKNMKEYYAGVYLALLELFKPKYKHFIIYPEEKKYFAGRPFRDLDIENFINKEIGKLPEGKQKKSA